ncbi:glycosyltransferase [Bacteroides cellulosilyticus]|uniref:glycosyltransferase n=1 Tax=Bacteroides cellulosilyticus TaxID=246787 RepID=UPI0018980DA5|nr:glycosyltransferase [Bacteroides cellulosilyticus]
MKVLGIFRGFPGLGRVVAGVSLLEELRDRFGYSIKFISYLQGEKYLQMRGCIGLPVVTSADYCSIGLLPTNRFAVYIFETIKSFNPDLIVIDGEPLILHSIKISFPDIKIVTLLNPSDVDNPSNDKEAMEYFNELYAMADMAIVHGLRRICTPLGYQNFHSINTIVRHDILNLQTNPRNEIYCILGGGTINVGSQFEATTLDLAQLTLDIAPHFPLFSFHIVSASSNIYDAVIKQNRPPNVVIHNGLLYAEECYSRAALVITRAGRNTTSELMVLGIPAVIFVAGDKYRIVEQTQNISELHCSSLIPITPNSSSTNVIRIIENLISLPKEKGNFMPGNESAITCCVNLLTK